MKKEKMVINRASCVDAIFYGYDVKLRRSSTGIIDWDIIARGGDIHGCKTKVQARKVLDYLIICFEENEEVLSFGEINKELKKIRNNIKN